MIMCCPCRNLPDIETLMQEWPPQFELRPELPQHAARDFPAQTLAMRLLKRH